MQTLTRQGNTLSFLEAIYDFCPTYESWSALPWISRLKPIYFSLIDAMKSQLLVLEEIWSLARKKTTALSKHCNQIHRWEADFMAQQNGHTERTEVMGGWREKWMCTNSLWEVKQESVTCWRMVTYLKSLDKSIFTAQIKPTKSNLHWRKLLYNWYIAMGQPSPTIVYASPPQTNCF